MKENIYLITSSSFRLLEDEIKKIRSRVFFSYYEFSSNNLTQ